MSNFNQSFFMGNLTRDPEFRYTQTGLAVAKFSLAVNRIYKVNGEQRQEVSYFDLTAFGIMAENINKYCHKGDPLFVSGRASQNRWQDESGNTRSRVEFIVEQFQFIGNRRQNTQSASEQQTADTPEEALEYDDLPI